MALIHHSPFTDDSLSPGPGLIGRAQDFFNDEGIPMPQAHPTYDQLADLPRYGSYTVPPEWVDANGHMNIRHYFDVGSQAAMERAAGLGLDAEYMTNRNLGVFTVEQHMRYLAEMRLGANLSTRVRIGGIGSRALLLASYVLDDDNRRLSMIFETMLVHISFSTRRTTDFPDDLREDLDAAVAAEDALGWDPALSGALRIR